MDSNATVYYIRSDGSSSTNCTGTTDAAYDGAGTGEACAFNHPIWAIGGVGTTRIMQGGDTLISRSGDEFMFGIGMPNTVGCTYPDQRNCYADAIPSGTPTNPTRLLGSQWNTGCATKSQWWGTGAVDRVIDLTGASNIEIQCLDVTDHSNCGWDQDDTNRACVKPTGVTSSLVGTYGIKGLHGVGATNVKIWNSEFHGFAVQGVTLSDLHGNTDIKNVNIDGNYNAGWEGDGRQFGGTGALQDGVFRAHKLKVRYNGCSENYPRSSTFSHSDYVQCTGQSNLAGYGDGLGSFNVSGTWYLTEPEFSWNTSDGLDLLYGDNNLSIYIDKGKFEGNVGNAVKVSGKNVELTNSAIVGNCTYHRLAGKLAKPSTFDDCRSGGVPLAGTTVLGSNWKMRNVSFYSAMDSDGSAFIEVSNRNGSCNGTEMYDFKNILAVNHAPGFWSSGNGFYNVDLTGGCATAWNNRTVTYSKMSGWGGTHAGTGNTSTAPAWVSTIVASSSNNIASMLLTSNVGGGNASTYWNTSTDLNNYPQNATIDQGAFQFGTAPQLAQAGQACVATTDCSTGTCDNFVCSGSCTANGGACSSGATCCSGYCNGSSLCAVPTTCGDGTVQPSETCDGSNLNGSNCIQQGFTGGSLSCASDCLSFVTTSCTNTTTFPLTPVLSTFTQSNGSISTSGDWNIFTGGFTVTSNAITPSGASTSQNIAIWSRASFGDDQEAYITNTTKGSNGDTYTLYLRGNLASQNAYAIVASPGSNQIVVYRLDDGVATQLGATISQAQSNGDSVGASIDGSTITVFYKASAGSWTSLTTRSDSKYSTGSQIGFGSTVGAGTADIVLDSFGGGTLGAVACGNGLKEGSEVCDGADLAGQSCTTFGYASGTLSCASNCSSFVTSSCTSASTCGNNTKELNELCDGTDLDNQTCVTKGFASGSISCASDCQSFNTVSCVAGTSGARGGMTIK